MKIAVAATAPFGADVLARLAASHEIAFLLTRPDAPSGRGRKLAAPPAKEAAERLGIAVLQPARPELPAVQIDAVVVCAYGLLIPSSLLERALWLNVHPSLLPRWRGAAPVERAILAGDPETGVTIHETVAELDAGPIAAQEAFPIGEADAGEVFARSAEIAARLLNAVLPALAFAPQAAEGATYAAKITPADRELDLSNPVDAWRRVRALSPHIGAWAELHGRRVVIWKARFDDGALRPRRGAARGPTPHELRGVRAWSASVTAPARQAAFTVVRRVFEDESYADRALASAAEGLDTRDRGLAQRIAYGTVQRTRTIDHGIDVLGSRPAAELDPPVRAALRIAGYELAWSDAPPHAIVNDAVELVRGAGLPHATGFTNAVARRLAEGFPALVESLSPGPLAESYPDWIHQLWVRDLGEEEALALMRARTSPPSSSCARRSRSERRRTSPAPTASNAARSTAAIRAASGRAVAPSWLRSLSARATTSGSSTRAPPPAPRRPC